MTHPTKEQALAALEDVHTAAYGGDQTLMPHALHTIRTYINGEKDSHGADEARKEALDALEKLHGRCTKTAHSPGGESIIAEWRDTIRAALSAPASAHVPGKVRELPVIRSYDGDIVSNPWEHRAILDQQDAPDAIKIEFSAGHMAGRKFEREYQTKCRNALRMKVEALHQDYPKPVVNAYEANRIDGHNAALSAVLAEIDAMMKAGV